MAIITGLSLWVIRDTEEETLMKGAKAQLAFESEGAARRSLVHTGWWDTYKEESALLALMPNAQSLLDSKNDLDVEYQRQMEVDWMSVDTLLRQAIRDANTEIYNWTKGNHKAIGEHRANIKFTKQTRFVVESLVSIETKEK